MKSYFVAELYFNRKNFYAKNLMMVLPKVMVLMMSVYLKANRSLFSAKMIPAVQTLSKPVHQK